MERCENTACEKPVDNYLYALENRGIIYKWVCERCYFKWVRAKEKKHLKKLEHESIEEN